MRIVIDLQGAQTGSRFRGIGRYSLSLARAIAQNRGQHEIVVALNALFPETIEPLREAFEGLLPCENIRIWHAPGPVRECQSGNEWCRHVAEKLREAFLASLQPDVVLVTSLFEGFVDDAVTSIGTFTSAFPTVVILYDLIPLLNPGKYFVSNPVYEKHYRGKLEHLKRANGYLAISHFSAQEGIWALSLRKDKIINISTACDLVFQKKNILPELLFPRLGVSKPFILNTGGAEERKNLSRLIQAFGTLPCEIRKNFQLVLAGKISRDNVCVLQSIVRTAGLTSKDCIFTGYVPDEDLVALYNHCFLFVFPSWHEGFGLPALEAMNCGAPVIGGNRSSLPEVIGWEGALFDPFDVPSISCSMERALTNNSFRQQLIDNAEEQVQKFSWNASAKKALEFFQKLHAGEARETTVSFRAKPKLAYISPLPPLRTGIADYSAELLPELQKFYDITVVVDQEKVSDPWIQLYCSIQKPEWFRKNAFVFDRVLYHIGNSPFHSYMLSLLEEIPGVVVLHDFFIGNAQWTSGTPNVGEKELLYSHGYKGVVNFSKSGNISEAVLQYPTNLSVLEKALGIIVHSKYSKNLAARWYGEKAGDSFSVIPHLRVSREENNKSAARHHLNLSENAFIVCSFGLLDPTKMNHRLLNSWNKSALGKDPRCMLLFVGENHGGNYGKGLLESIADEGLQSRVFITGWVDTQTFRNYLAAADVAVQLRACSRGETSGTILDCMNYGIATIVNAHGSSAHLSAHAVRMLPDAFSDEEMIQELENLRSNPEMRRALGIRAHREIEIRHSPRECARKYFDTLERFYAKKPYLLLPSLMKSIAEIDEDPGEKENMQLLAEAIARNYPKCKICKQLLLDISATCGNDLKTGIERVTRSLLLALLESPPLGYKVEPVYLSQEGNRWCYRYARSYTMSLLECPQDIFTDEVAEIQQGDILLCLDLSGSLVIDAHHAGLYQSLKHQGVRVFSMVYDLLPISMPHCFPPDAENNHRRWLEAILEMDGCICISKVIADEVLAWIKDHAPHRQKMFQVTWSHLGADIQKSAPSKGLSGDASEVLANLSKRPTFLMIGTVEPRKGYLQTLKAFTELWGIGKDWNLVIVGKEGWRHLPKELRRTIPDIVLQLQDHPEREKRLFWLQGVSDEYLEEIYGASTCLIAASEGEGFGLPLIEAAKHKLPIIARDIPVFREVAGEHAFYFSGLQGRDLAKAIQVWLNLYSQKAYPKSDALPWLTWKESAERLKNILITKEESEEMPEGIEGKNDILMPEEK